MAHIIKMSAPPVFILNSDVTFDVQVDGRMLGSVRISRGTVEWRPAEFTYGFHMSWEEFDRLMREHGVRPKRPRRGQIEGNGKRVGPAEPPARDLFEMAMTQGQAIDVIEPPAAPEPEAGQDQEAPGEQVASTTKTE